jgi:hypothetical protein
VDAPTNTAISRRGVRLESNHDDRILRADDTLVLFGDLQPRTIARETTVDQARFSVANA